MPQENSCSFKKSFLILVAWMKSTGFRGMSYRHPRLFLLEIQGCNYRLIHIKRKLHSISQKVWKIYPVMSMISFPNSFLSTVKKSLAGSKKTSESGLTTHRTENHSRVGFEENTGTIRNTGSKKIFCSKKSTVNQN